MNFAAFVKMYLDDIKPRIKYNTYLTKKNIIENKIIPYFKNLNITDVKAVHIAKWQNIMLKANYSPVYLRTINNQLSAIFNYAVKYYDLPKNPSVTAGKMGKAKSKEMLFWTVDEYKKFRKEIIDNDIMFCAFEILFFTGCRCGELLALTPSDFDFAKKTMRINKSYQRLEKTDYITGPKTEKSNRVIVLPDFLCNEIKDYISMLYKVNESDRIFPITKSSLHRAMKIGCKKSGVKKIRIHDLRHSSVAYLIEMGFSPVAIAERLGHESIEITYNYAHLYPSKQSEMADKIDSMFSEEDNGKNE